MSDSDSRIENSSTEVRSVDFGIENRNYSQFFLTGLQSTSVALPLLSVLAASAHTQLSHPLEEVKLGVFAHHSLLRRSVGDIFS